MINHNSNPTIDKGIVARFWAKVEKASPDACWQWVGAKSNRDYGVFWDGRRLVGAHRFAYELMTGAIPDGLLCDHACHNRLCVNPAHIRICTQTENNQNKLTRRDNTVGFKGVRQVPGGVGWQARIKGIGLGTFPTPELAHAAYCEAALKHFGEFANFGGAA